MYLIGVSPVVSLWSSYGQMLFNSLASKILPIMLFHLLGRAKGDIVPGQSLSDKYNLSNSTTEPKTDSTQTVFNQLFKEETYKNPKKSNLSLVIQQATTSLHHSKLTPADARAARVAALAHLAHLLDTDGIPEEYTSQVLQVALSTLERLYFSMPKDVRKEITVSTSLQNAITDIGTWINKNRRASPSEKIIPDRNRSQQKPLGKHEYDLVPKILSLLFRSSTTLDSIINECEKDKNRPSAWWLIASRIYKAFEQNNAPLKNYFHRKLMNFFKNKLESREAIENNQLQAIISFLTDCEVTDPEIMLKTIEAVRKHFPYSTAKIRQDQSKDPRPSTSKRRQRRTKSLPKQLPSMGKLPLPSTCKIEKKQEKAPLVEKHLLPPTCNIGRDPATPPEKRPECSLPFNTQDAAGSKPVGNKNSRLKRMDKDIGPSSSPVSKITSGQSKLLEGLENFLRFKQEFFTDPIKKALEVFRFLHNL